jgi:hypothetical protein
MKNLKNIIMKTDYMKLKKNTIPTYELFLIQLHKPAKA